MRFLSNLLLGLVAAVLVLALAVFALQNIGAVPVQFLGYRATGNVWWVVLAAAALGFVVAMLLMAPGRVAASWRIQGLWRQLQRQDQELATVRQQGADAEAEHNQLQQQYQQLQTQHNQLASEHQDMAAERERLLMERNQLRQQPVMAQPDPAPAIIPGMAAAPFVEMPSPPEAVQSDVPREDEVVTQRPYRTPSDEEIAHDVAPVSEQPSLADRVRNFFGQPSEPAAPAESPDADGDTTLPDSAFPRENGPVSPMP